MEKLTQQESPPLSYGGKANLQSKKEMFNETLENSLVTNIQRIVRKQIFSYKSIVNLLLFQKKFQDLYPEKILGNFIVARLFFFFDR